MTIENDDKLEDVRDLLNEEDDKKEEEVEGEEDKEEVEEKDGEEKEEELEGDEEDEEVEINEDEDELSYSSVPSRKEVLAKFPELYKTFPSLEKAVYREQQYAEIFPTLKEAKEVADGIKNYQNLENQLANGNIKNLFQNLHKNYKDAYGKITENIFETLSAVDSESYKDVLNQFAKSLIINAHNSFKDDDSDEGKNILAAAQWLHKWLYNSHKITPYDKKFKSEDKEPSKEEEKFKTERQQYRAERIKEATNQVSERASNLIKSTIEKHIDPKGAMSDYVKDKAVDDAFGEVYKTIMDDRRFRIYLDKLWIKAEEKNFNKEYLDNIRNALITKAKPSLRGVINNVRAKALKGVTSMRKKKDDDDEVEEFEERQPKKISKSNNEDKGNKAPSSFKQIKSARDIPSGLSTRDLLNMD